MIVLLGGACAGAATQIALSPAKNPGVTVVYKDPDGEWPGGRTGPDDNQSRAEAARLSGTGNGEVWI